MSRLKNTMSAIRWNISRNKVNSAVSVFAKYGASFSLSDAKEGLPIDGVVGLPKNLSKREVKKIESSAVIMTRNNASYSRTSIDKKRFTQQTALEVGHYAPLKFADQPSTQEASYRQSNASMHLRAPQKFLQRTLFDPRLQVHPNRHVLSMSAVEAQEWAGLTESIWRSEKESKDWDESRINDYSQLSDMAFSDYIGKGEFFAVRRQYLGEEDRLTNMSIQIFSPFQIQSPIFTTNNWIRTSRACGDTTGLINAYEYLSGINNGNYIEGGIEYSSNGQEVAIYIAPITLGGEWVKVPVKNKAGFTQVLHGFIQTEPGQKRGIPESAYAWHEFMNIKDLSLFELQSARLNSSISGTVTADSNAQPNGKTPMNELGNQKPGWGDVAPIQNELPPYKEPDYDVRDVNGGGFIVQNFTPGYKYTEHDTKRPNINIPAFIEKMLEFVYPAMYGLSVTVVNQRLEGSYNASKGKIDLTWKNGVEYFLKQFSSDWHRPNYSAWLAGKVATGEIAVSGWEDLKKRNAWCSMSIITPAKPSLNPKQEAEAGKIRCDNLFSNRELEAQQQTGTSSDNNAEKLIGQNEQLVEANSPFASLEESTEDIENE